MAEERLNRLAIANINEKEELALKLKSNNNFQITHVQLID